MKEFLIKARRAIRYLFYKNVSIQDQLKVSKVLNDSELELLFWKLSKADRHHSAVSYTHLTLPTNREV